MEDVLDVYCQPYDPSLPRICMDEMGKNAGHQTNIPPPPAKPGQVAREDYTYEKEGSANLFIARRSIGWQTVCEGNRAPHQEGLGFLHEGSS